MEYEDQEIICRDCKEVFEWTAGEQKFMHDLFISGKLDKDGVEGKIVPPLRCQECRRIHKEQYRR